MIAAGTYRARCTGEQDVQFGFSKTGNEQIAVVFRITEGECAGHTVTWFGSFASEKSIKIALKALENCGWKGDNVTDLSGIGSEEVDLVIDHEPDQENRPRLRVQWVNKPGASGRVELRDQMSAAQKVAFAQKMKGQILSARQSAGTPRRETPKPATPKHDEDIPF